MIYYCIRHKSTGELMSQMRRGRGYSYWNPNGDLKFQSVCDRLKLGVPRLIDTRRKAARCIVAQNSMPNSRNDLDGDIDIRVDNRKREDLEIVEVNLELSDDI